jgi:hypothetical protein
MDEVSRHWFIFWRICCRYFIHSQKVRHHLSNPKGCIAAQRVLVAFGTPRWRIPER